MPNKTLFDSSNIPNGFIQKYQDKISGVLHGFDRLRFSGCLRALYHVPVMEEYLCKSRVLFKDFKGFALNVTDKIKAATQAIAQGFTCPPATALRRLWLWNWLKGIGSKKA